MTLHPITIDCVNCGAVGTMTASDDGQPPAVVHVEGDDVRYCRPFPPTEQATNPAVAEFLAPTGTVYLFGVQDPTCITAPDWSTTRTEQR